VAGWVLQEEGPKVEIRVRGSFGSILRANTHTRKEGLRTSRWRSQAVEQALCGKVCSRNVFRQLHPSPPVTGCELPGQEPGLGQRVGSQTEATPRVHLMVAPTYTARFPADPGISAALKEEFGPQAQHPQKEGWRPQQSPPLWKGPTHLEAPQWSQVSPQPLPGLGVITSLKLKHFNFLLRLETWHRCRKCHYW
jgi:hypothetical protein